MTAVHLQLLERDKESAQKTLAVKAKIDEMPCHLWDFEAAELEKRLQRIGVADDDSFCQVCRCYLDKSEMVALYIASGPLSLFGKEVTSRSQTKVRRLLSIFHKRRKR